MLKLQCELCGSTDILKTVENVYQCQHCGCKYTLEQARSLIITGEVKTKAADFEIIGGTLKKYNGEDVDVVIPSNVVVIGESAFRRLKGLRSVKLPSSLREIEKDAFEDCSSITEVNIPGNVKVIGYEAFEGCSSLSEVTIGEGVEEIDSYAFSKTNITQVYVPDSVRSLALSAFDKRVNYISVPCREIVDRYSDSYICHDSIIEFKHNYSKVVFRSDSERRKNNLCLYCGGEFKGLVKKVCTVCGMEKTYKKSGSKK